MKRSAKEMSSSYKSPSATFQQQNSGQQKEPSKKALKKAGRVNTAPQNVLDLMLKIGRERANVNIFDHISARDAVNLSQVNRRSQQASQTRSIVPQLQGVRRVADSEMWSTDPVGKSKRYFKPMTGTGQTPSFPHISEQEGHDKHLSDVASMNWGAKRGRLPSKIQFREDRRKRSDARSYSLGEEANLPKKANSSRVLTPAPEEMGEPANTFVNVNSYNQAKRKGSALPPSHPRVRLTQAQIEQPLAEVNKKWAGQKVDKSDKT